MLTILPFVKQLFEYIEYKIKISQEKNKVSIKWTYLPQFQSLTNIYSISYRLIRSGCLIMYDSIKPSNCFVILL